MIEHEQLYHVIGPRSHAKPLPLETILKISVVAHPTIATAKGSGEIEAMVKRELFKRK